ncbi:MAG: DUF3267 domain-containing protein [Fermentimonas sp.]|jgi:fatty acid desaturase|nr:DUF3267 domain-containing protein [Fermentimonas sp.]
MTYLDHYIKEKKTIDIYKASKLAVILFIVSLILFGLPFYFIWQPETVFSWYSILIFTMLFIVGIVLHELIHGLFFGLFAEGGFRSIRFGVLWEYLTPYCHCNEPLKLRHYMIGAVMPAILIGIIPAIVSLFNGSLMLLVLGVIFISAAAGDFMVMWILRKENMESYIEDHPSEPGCFIYRVPNQEKYADIR